MEPLANKIRPQNLDEYIGQQHLVGEGKPLRVAIQQKHLFSFILWGPPGVGKTTLARIYAKAVDAEFFELSAVSAGKEDIREIIQNTTPSPHGATPPIHRRPSKADYGGQERRGILQMQPAETLPLIGGVPRWQSGGGGKPKILFLDEIHRFNKAQQDFLLPYVESGKLTLIGATTENPSFEVIPALLSRCRVFVLNELTPEEMEKVIKMTGYKLKKDAKDWLIHMAGGDARQAITMIENTVKLYDTITVETLKDTLQSKTLRYDKKGEEHYNTISAFIKSMRAGQPDAALYYLARMIEAGEDPKFIARRMVIFASEDIGLAQPTALVVANEIFRAVEIIGLPECAINLAHGVSYLSLCPKDRSSYDAYFEAAEDVKKYGNLPIPLTIRNAPTKLMKELGYGKGYERYPDKNNDNNNNFLPEQLKDRKYLKRKGNKN